jgi:hypothetical protein
MEIRKASLITTIAMAGLMFAAGGAMAYTAKPIYVKGYGAGSFINTTFSFYAGGDGLTTATGNDNVGGAYFVQGVSEYYDSDDTCWAIDGTLGEKYDKYLEIDVGTYLNGGQIYSYSVDGTECISLSTGVINGVDPTVTYGGSGKFAGASGSGVTYFTGVDLYSPEPPGTGFFGSIQYTNSGSVTP